MPAVPRKPTSPLPLQRGRALVILNDLLADVSTRRLVQVGIRP